MATGIIYQSTGGTFTYTPLANSKIIINAFLSVNYYVAVNNITILQNNATTALNYSATFHAGAGVPFTIFIPAGVGCTVTVSALEA